MLQKSQHSSSSNKDASFSSFREDERQSQRSQVPVLDFYNSPDKDIFATPKKPACSSNLKDVQEKIEDLPEDIY
jgi:hypothetical protein